MYVQVKFKVSKATSYMINYLVMLGLPAHTNLILQTCSLGEDEEITLDCPLCEVLLDLYRSERRNRLSSSNILYIYTQLF